MLNGHPSHMPQQIVFEVLELSDHEGAKVDHILDSGRIRPAQCEDEAEEVRQREVLSIPEHDVEEVHEANHVDTHVLHVRSRPRVEEEGLEVSWVEVRMVFLDYADLSQHFVQVPPDVARLQ